MKKISTTLIAMILLLGCENEINVTTPTILIENPSASVLDSITIRVEEFAEVDGNRIEADYYYWFIENNNGEVKADDFPNSSTIIWVPQEAGYFIIKVRIGYDNNKSITAIKEITIKESTLSLQKKAIGHWKGKGTKANGGEWDIEIFIDGDKHYYGTADFNGFDPYCDRGVFNMGRLDYFHGPQYGVGSYFDSCGTPGNILCQTFNITGVSENKGEGIMTIGWVYVYTDITDTACYNVGFNNLTIESDRLYFEILDDYQTRKIDLLRQ